METLNSSGNDCSFINRATTQPWEAFNSGETIWSEFTPAQQERIVKYFAPKVKYLALRLKSRLPQSVELTELISAGTLGLMESFNKFQPSLGNKFDTYAESRIKGAMLDELRKLDWYPRSLRKKIKILDEAIHKLERESHDSPSEEVLADATGLDVKEVREGLEAMQNRFCVSLDFVQDTVSNNDSSREGEPFKQIAFEELVEKLSGLINELTPREKMVLSLYYTDELNMRETASVMGITEGRVSQLHSQALSRLRKEFSTRLSDVNVF